MKSVLISIKPKWCELIASGKKTVEVRKTRPTIGTPFKCYIYCTESNKEFLQSRNNILFYCENRDFIGGHGEGMYKRLNGKVIGEFVCDITQIYECEFVDDDCYEEIARVAITEDGDEMGFIEWSNDGDFPYENIDLYKESCVEYNELKRYMGMGFSTFYGWHISDLVIYDKPKKLSEFRKHIPIFDGITTEELETEGINGLRLKRPPQSWCYVEK